MVKVNENFYTLQCISCHKEYDEHETCTMCLKCNNPLDVISHSELYNPDFVALANAFGIPAWKASTYEEAKIAMEEAGKIDGPTLITFQVDPDEHVYPMVPPNTALGDQALCDEEERFSDIHITLENPKSDINVVMNKLQKLIPVIDVSFKAQP